MRVVVIDGKEHSYLFGLQAMAIYERMTGESFGAGVNTTSTLAAHFSCLVAGDVNFPLSFEQFVRAVDNKQTFDALAEALREEVERWSSVSAVPGEADGSKKKKKAK